MKARIIHLVKKVIIEMEGRVLVYTKWTTTLKEQRVDVTHFVIPYVKKYDEHQDIFTAPMTYMTAKAWQQLFIHLQDFPTWTPYQINRLMHLRIRRAIAKLIKFLPSPAEHLITREPTRFQVELPNGNGTSSIGEFKLIEQTGTHTVTIMAANEELY